MSRQSQNPEQNIKRKFRLVIKSNGFPHPVSEFSVDIQDTQDTRC